VTALNSPVPAPAAEPLVLYNTLTRQKAAFEPIVPGTVGIYLCGPTVYNEPHLGNARGPVVFDVLRRYFLYRGLTVRFVRNITDVGHLESDADTGDDKIAKEARLKKLEPMQVAQNYTRRYQELIGRLNVLPPDIEPQATGHITEQIQLVEEILENGFAYEANGSVYFDVAAYQAAGGNYGKLSGRVVEELLANTRDTLEGQEEKRAPADFALWKKASPTHLMRWPSPWGEGFPGWHLECSAMSRKYLGDEFDLHGGGLDLMFPHHECEIAQGRGSRSGKDGPRWWMHNNMITVNGTKMGKSLGNFILLSELYDGAAALGGQAFTPMTARFFLLQTHYRSPADVTADALVAARKGYHKMLNGLLTLPALLDLAAATPAPETLDPQAGIELRTMADRCFEGLNDDLNTARTVASLFDVLRRLNALSTKPTELATVGLEAVQYAVDVFRALVTDVLGLVEEAPDDVQIWRELGLNFYRRAKESKDYATVDALRGEFKRQGLLINDTKAGARWVYDE
jgi:cysteinyl-tRNA synthetase